MPVFVTHADTGVGPALVRALCRDGADVRAYATGDGDVDALQGAGATVAVGDMDDEGHLDAAMTHAHTVVVPTVGWLDDPAIMRATLPVVLAAAVQAGVARIVLASLVGADPGSDVPVLAVLGEVEAAAVASPPQTLVVRTDGVVEHGHGEVVAALAGHPDVTMAPVATADLADGLVALDAARSSTSGGHAVFTALGARRPVSAWLQAPTEGEGGDLVGRRWLPPARRDPVVAAIVQRGGPDVDGADLWEFS